MIPQVEKDDEKSLLEIFNNLIEKNTFGFDHQQVIYLQRKNHISLQIEMKTLSLLETKRSTQNQKQSQSYLYFTEKLTKCYQLTVNQIEKQKEEVKMMKKKCDQDSKELNDINNQKRLLIVERNKYQEELHKLKTEHSDLIFTNQKKMSEVQSQARKDFANQEIKFQKEQIKFQEEKIKLQEDIDNQIITSQNEIADLNKKINERDETLMKSKAQEENNLEELKQNKIYLTNLIDEFNQSQVKLTTVEAELKETKLKLTEAEQQLSNKELQYQLLQIRKGLQNPNDIQSLQKGLKRRSKSFSSSGSGKLNNAFVSSGDAF